MLIASVQEERIRSKNTVGTGRHDARKAAFSKACGRIGRSHGIISEEEKNWRKQKGETPAFPVLGPVFGKNNEPCTNNQDPDYYCQTLIRK